MTPTTTEECLAEYARWRHEPGYQYSESPPNTLERIRTDRRNPPPGIGCSGPAMTLIDTGDGEPVAVPPDGGIGARIDRWARGIDRDNRCTFIKRMLRSLRDDEPDLHATFDAIYHGEWFQPIRTERGAAEDLGVTRHELRQRRPAMLEWFAERLRVPMRAAA